MMDVQTLPVAAMRTVPVTVDQAPQYAVTLQHIVQRLIQTYHPQQVILFGSLAYGHPNEDSDIDLLIIKETDESPLERRVTVRRLVADPARRIPFSPLVLTPAELTQRLGLGDPFYQEILMPDSTIPAEWLAQGDLDLQAADILLAQNGPLSVVAFHLQQALEKYFKGFLLFRQHSLQRIHDLEILVQQAIVVDADFAPYLTACQRITEYYIEARYPVGIPTHFSRARLVTDLQTTRSESHPHKASALINISTLAKMSETRFFSLTA